MHVELEDAHGILIRNIGRLVGEEVRLTDSLQRIAASDVYAQSSLPAHSLAARDGYAVCSQDYTRNVFKKIADTSVLQPGEAVLIATGGVIPAGTTELIPCEDVFVSEGYVEIKQKETGSFIRKAGEDFISGDCIVKKGMPITPGHIALLAAYGTEGVFVYRQPRVAIISLTPTAVQHQRTPRRGENRDSNGPLLNALVNLENAVVTGVTAVTDMRKEEISQLIKTSCQQNDLVITNGGTFSSGEDEARAQLEAVGAEILYWGTAIQPGGHNGAGMLGDTPILCLSGNPAACAVGFHLLVAPVLRLMQGLSPALVKAKVTFSEDIPLKNRRCFLRGKACCGADGWEACLLSGQKPGMIRSLLDYNCLLDVSSGQRIAKGEQATAIMISSNHNYC